MQIRHRAVCIHLEHGRGYVDAAVIRWNVEHRSQIRKERVVWTDYGISKESADASSINLLRFPAEKSTATRRAA
jgi:hypothetical protein